MYVKEQYRYSELTGKILACAFEVHKFLGNGFQEVIDQRALQYEMLMKGISFLREFEMPIYYKEELIGSRRVDFLIEGDCKLFCVNEIFHLMRFVNLSPKIRSN